MKKNNLWSNNWFKLLLIPVAVIVIATLIATAIISYFKVGDNQNKIEVNSYNQQNGITANEVTIGSIARHLTNEEGENIESTLRAYSAKGIYVSTIELSGESYNYAYEIKEYLESKGWHVIWQPSMPFLSGPIRGLQYYQPPQIPPDAPKDYVEIVVGDNPTQ